MKTETQTVIYLESKESRAIIAAFLGIEPEKIIKTAYGFGIKGLNEDERKIVEDKIEKLD